MISRAKANIPYITDTHLTPLGAGINYKYHSLNIIKENIRCLKGLRGKREKKKREREKNLSLLGLRNLKIFFSKFVKENLSLG